MISRTPAAVLRKHHQRQRLEVSQIVRRVLQQTEGNEIDQGGQVGSSKRRNSRHVMKIQMT